MFGKRRLHSSSCIRMENVASTFPFHFSQKQKNRKQNKKKITWKNVNNEKSERAPRRTKDSHRYNGRYRYKYSYSFGQRCCGRSEHARRGPIIAKSRRKNARDEAINCFECSLMQFAGDPLLSLSFSPPPWHSAPATVPLPVPHQLCLIFPLWRTTTTANNKNNNKSDSVSFSRSIFGLAKPALSCRLE